jgi:hypothetical protein
MQTTWIDRQLNNRPCRLSALVKCTLYSNASVVPEEAYCHAAVGTPQIPRHLMERTFPHRPQPYPSGATPATERNLGGAWFPGPRDPSVSQLNKC